MGAVSFESRDAADAQRTQERARVAALFEGPRRRAEAQPTSTEPCQAGPELGRAGGAGKAEAAAMQALYGGMYAGGGAQGSAAGAQGAGKKPTPLGLAGYEVVPDGHKGPLKPNQLRKSQLDDLKRFQFDTLQVVDDETAKAGRLTNEQMTQAQFQKLAQAWLNIKDGHGLSLSGSQADQTTFRKMLRQGLGDSPVLRQLISDIGTDEDPTHAIAANVGRGQASTFIDSFDTSAVDLGDIERMPSAPSKDHKNEATRGEQLVHILGERRAAAVAPGRQLYRRAHAEGTRLHNQYRAERGQAAETGARNELRNGREHIVFSYSDGTSEELELDNNSDIVNIQRP
jgi:hypothetical protein